MKRLLDRIFYIPKYYRPKEKSITRLLMPSVVGVLLCMFCLAGTTWAWYAATIQSGSRQMKATTFTLDVSVVGDNGVPVTEDENGNFRLVGGTKYIVTLTANGTASNGYGRVKIGNEEYNTDQISKGESLRFATVPATDTTLSVVAVWGNVVSPNLSSNATITLPGASAEKPAAVAPTEPPATEPPATEPPATEAVDTYQVQSGDSLWEIANQFDTTVEKLAAYNGIDPAAVIRIGQTLKIPPADWEIPAAPATEPPTQATDATETPTDAPTTEPESGEQSQPPLTEEPASGAASE